MPLRKLRSLQEAEDALWREPGPELWKAVQRVWDFAARSVPRRIPPGVYRHRSIEEAQAQRDRWQQDDFRAFWDRQRAAGADDPWKR